MQAQQLDPSGANQSPKGSSPRDRKSRSPERGDLNSEINYGTAAGGHSLERSFTGNDQVTAAKQAKTAIRGDVSENGRRPTIEQLNQLDDALAFDRDDYNEPIIYNTPQRPPPKKIQNSRSLIQLHKTEVPSILAKKLPPADDNVDEMLAKVPSLEDTDASIGGALADYEDATNELKDLLDGVVGNSRDRDPQAAKLLGESPSAAAFIMTSLSLAFLLDQQEHIAGLLKDNNKLLIQLCV